jgi:serine/threonine protein kinase
VLRASPMPDVPQNSEVNRARARVGHVLKGKWRLDQLLGIGGMAVVYAATHRNGNRVAVKVLHAELARNADVNARFLREGYLANSVDHAGAVSVIDDDVGEDGSVFLVMELLEGETIERRWERKGRRLPIVEVLSIADRLLDVLASAHAKEIVHRDIKPENVFLTREGEIKVLDFGIARVRELSPRANATQGGTTMGTPPFMPPEQARGRWDEVDARTDLFAVGAMMFALVTGRFVHEADTVNEQLLSAMTRHAPKVASIVRGVHPAVADVIDRALAFKMEERWHDAHAMKSAIRRAYRASQGDGSTSLPVAPRYTDIENETNDVSSISLRIDETSEPGVVSAPSAAPAADTLPSARLPTRTPFVVGLLAAALGVLITLAAFAYRSGAPAVASSAGLVDPVAVTLPPADDPRLTHPSDDAPTVEIEVPAASEAAPDAGKAGSSARVSPRVQAASSGGDVVDPATVSGALPARSSPGLLDRRH